MPALKDRILKTRMPPRPNSPLSTPAGELALIDKIRERAGRLPPSWQLRLGIGDDCAILQPGAGQEIVVTTDFCLEGRHWTRVWNSPQSAGHRTLARGLSDLAAMGARPVAALLSLALPAETARDNGWVDGFLDGLLALAARHGCPLAGGDTSESPSKHVLADIVCLGAVPRGSALLRSGARPGDALYVTGYLGAAAVGMQRIAEAAANGVPAAWAAQSGGQPFLFPKPRLRAGQALREQRFATACMDLSDGLSTDLHHLCEASNVSAEVEATSLPHFRFVRELPPEEALNAMLHGGEDYQLLCTAPPHLPKPQGLGVRLTRIGTIRPAAGPGEPVVTLRLPGGRVQPLEPQGWEHLR